MPLGNTTTVVVKSFKIAERSDGCSGERNIVGSFCKKEEVAKEDDYLIGAEEFIGMFIKS